MKRRRSPLAPADISCGPHMHDVGLGVIPHSCVPILPSEHVHGSGCPGVHSAAELREPRSSAVHAESPMESPSAATRAARPRIKNTMNHLRNCQS